MSRLAKNIIIGTALLVVIAVFSFAIFISNFEMFGDPVKTELKS